MLKSLVREVREGREGREKQPDPPQTRDQMVRLRLSGSTTSQRILLTGRAGGGKERDI